MKVDSASVTLPDEGPEQRWRRTVRKRPAKLKLGRLLRDFGYSELDDDVADAIEARMAGVGLAVRPSLREAAADEIVTVYRPHGADDDGAAAAPRPREAAAAAPERPRPTSRRASDPDSTRAISDLKGQLADARAESARLRTELDNRIAAMADADRRARQRLAEQTAVVDEQAHRLAELSGLLNETRAALAEARDEIRRALGDLPAAVIEAPMEVGGLSEEEGWLTDADEPRPPSPVEAAVSAIASPVDEPDELAPDAGDLGELVSGADADADADAGADEPAADLDPLPMDDVFADAASAGDELPAAGAEAPPADDDDLVFEPELPVAAAEALAPEVPAEEDVFEVEAEAPAQDEVFGLEPEAPADEDVFSLEAEEPEDDDVFGPLPEASPPGDGFTLETEPAPETIVRPATPARRSGFFTLEPMPPPPDDVPVSEADPPPASADAAPEESPPDDEWRLDDEPAPAGPADRPPAGVSAEADDLTFATTADDFDEPAPAPVPEPTAWTDDAPGALPPPPPLPPSPFADELPARPPELGELPSRQPAKRGRMARGRGRWQGTCSVCERFPEVSRRKDLEAAGWQLDGDFPTCPQCRGLA